MITVQVVQRPDKKKWLNQCLEIEMIQTSGAGLNINCACTVLAH